MEVYDDDEEMLKWVDYCFMRTTGWGIEQPTPSPTPAHTFQVEDAEAAVCATDADCETSEVCACGRRLDHAITRKLLFGTVCYCQRT